LFAVALPLRSATTGTTHSADACDVQVDIEEKIPLVAAVGQVADNAGNGKEMAVRARRRFAPLKRAFYSPKGASKRLNGACMAALCQQIKTL
jgi:hypothetical protein